MPKPLHKIDDENALPQQAVWLLRAGFFAMAMIILLFTPYTNNLDEIKVSLLYFMGPVLVCLYVYFYMRGYVRGIPKFTLYAVLGYLALLFFSMLLSRYKWLGIRLIGFHFALLGFFLVMAGSIINKKYLHDAVWFFVLMGFLTSAFGMFHYFGGFSFVNNELMTTAGRSTPVGMLVYTLAQTKDMLSTILSRDFFASFLVFLYPLVISAFIVTNSTRSRIFIAASALMMFVCFFLALSKDSFAGFGFSLAAYALLYWKFCRYKKLNIHYLWVWVIGICLWSITLFYMTWDYFEPILRNIDTGIKSRSIIWGGGIGIWLNSPKNFIIGGGPGSFRVLFPPHRAPDYFLHDISNVTLFAHNRYIDLLAENGILGFIVYMLIIGSVFYYSVVTLTRCKDGELRVYQLGILTSLLGLLFTNIFSPNVRWTVVASSYWAIMGLSVGAYTLWRQGPLIMPKRNALQKLKPAQISILSLSVFLTLGCWLYGYAHFKGAYYNNQGLVKMRYVEDLGDRMSTPQKQKYLLDAIDFFKKATRTNPTFMTSYYKVAHCYNQLSALQSEDVAKRLQYQKDALDAYITLQQYANDYAEIHFNLGIVNRSLYSLDSSNKEYLTKSLDEFIKAGEQSNKILVQYRLAESYKTNGDLDNAIAVLERIPSLSYQRNVSPMEHEREVKIKEQAPYTLFSYYVENKNFDKAEAMALEMLQKNPGDNMMIHNLSSVYNRNGEKEKAIDFFLKVLEMNPAHTTARIGLAVIYESNGDYESAIDQLELLKFYEPGKPQIDNQIKNLKRLIAAKKSNPTEIDKTN